MPGMGIGWRPEHKPIARNGSPLCDRCGLPPSEHRTREPRADYYRAREKLRPKRNGIDRIIGLDGEGRGRRPHRYTYLAASDEMERTWSVENVDGEAPLSTVQCLEFIMRLPERSLVFGYGFLYDLTKILADVDDRSLWLLSHEESRAFIHEGRIKYRPVEWRSKEGGLYSFNFMNRCFSVSRGKRHATVWDIIRFFQSKFTSALIDWKVADTERLKQMEVMKDKRAEFDKVPIRQVQLYCKEECYYLANLGRALIKAHEQAGLKLKHYYGAGSTASALLSKMGIASKRGEIPRAMREPVASAFFGGRFENSCIGPVRRKVWNYDISSAYPYQATFLPCLEHGKWEHHKKPKPGRIERATLALIHWSVAHDEQLAKKQAWGPFPVRTEKGTIVFPLAAAGGWTWKDEYLAGCKIAPNTSASEAWLYHTDCACNPFSLLPEIYIERLRIGKDGKGIVLKLGPNSVYGKLAQSKGVNPPYQSWVWAGNITSGCRAQLLESLLLVSDPWAILMFATDGVWSSERLSFSRPKDTQTWEAVDKKDGKSKPLGGWEEKEFPDGVFAARPGIYFPMKPTEDALKEVRARGLGKSVLYDQWHRILDIWELTGEGKFDRLTIGPKEISGNRTSVDIEGITRFVGIKSGITHSSQGFKRSSDYGEWIPWPISVTFDPAPKRKSVMPGGRLEPWQYFHSESVPYKEALRDPEQLKLQEAEMIAQEQPDGAFADLEKPL